jgi:predicted transcriptional regulator
MTPKLSADQRQALRDRPQGPVAVEDDETHQVYVIVDQHWHQRAAEALRQQEDIAAIREGIEDMEAGRVVPFEETDARMRAKLGLPPRS